MASAVAKEHKRFHTAPSRLRKRDVPVVWDLFALDDRAETNHSDDESTTDASHAAPSSVTQRLSRAPSVASLASEDVSTEHSRFPNLPNVERGGSWPRIRKQRTNEGSMSLFEVAEFLGAEQPPPAKGGARSKPDDDLACLASLVEEEQKEQQPATEAGVSVDSFVDEVFKGIPPRPASGPQTPHGVAAVHAAEADPAAADALTALPPAAPMRPTTHTHSAVAPTASLHLHANHNAAAPPREAKKAATPSANDLALLEAMAADEAAAQAAHGGPPALGKAGSETDDVFRMLAMDGPPLPTTYGSTCLGSSTLDAFPTTAFPTAIDEAPYADSPYAPPRMAKGGMAKGGGQGSRHHGGHPPHPHTHQPHPHQPHPHQPHPHPPHSRHAPEHHAPAPQVSSAAYPQPPYEGHAGYGSYDGYDGYDHYGHHYSGGYGRAAAYDGAYDGGYDYDEATGGYAYAAGGPASVAGRYPPGAHSAAPGGAPYAHAPWGYAASGGYEGAPGFEPPPPHAPPHGGAAHEGAHSGAAAPYAAPPSLTHEDSGGDMSTEQLATSFEQALGVPLDDLPCMDDLALPTLEPLDAHDGALLPPLPMPHHHAAAAGHPAAHGDHGHHQQHRGRGRHAQSSRVPPPHVAAFFGGGPASALAAGAAGAPHAPPGAEGGGVGARAEGGGGGGSSRSQKEGRNGAERKEWSASEDEIIRESVGIHGCRWRRIAANLPGRSDDAVRNRWNRLKDMGYGQDDKAGGGGGDSGAAAGGDSGEEMGDGGSALPIPPLSADGASGGGAPPAKREPRDSSKPERISWTKTEDETILRSVDELGHKWNRIAERLPGRTDHAIRNRFHRLQSLLEDRARQQQRVLASDVPPLPMPTGPMSSGFETPDHAMKDESPL